MARKKCVAWLEATTTMTNTDRIETEVMDAFRGLVDASRALDAGRYFEYIDHERFTGLGADGTAWLGFEDLETVISGGFQMIERIVCLEFPKVKVTVLHPCTAILVNEFRQTLLLKNGQTIQQSGGGMQVWSQSASAWKLVGIAASDAHQRADAVF